MPENTKAPRSCELREAQGIVSLAGERLSLTLPRAHPQANRERLAAIAHHQAALATVGAHQAGELALAAFYHRRADALEWRIAA